MSLQAARYDRGDLGRGLGGVADIPADGGPLPVFYTCRTCVQTVAFPSLSLRPTSTTACAGLHRCCCCRSTHDITRRCLNESQRQHSQVGQRALSDKTTLEKRTSRVLTAARTRLSAPTLNQGQGGRETDGKPPKTKYSIRTKNQIQLLLRRGAGGGCGTKKRTSYSSGSRPP